MKVIFLDIDGVLNVESYLSAVVDVCKREGLDFNKHIRDEYGDLFCPLTVRYLNWIIESCDAKIVISSTWRMSGLTVMKEMWKYRELPGEIIGITPVTRSFKPSDLSFKEQAERGNEIKQYLQEHKEITNYVIIDDDDDFLQEQEGNFIQTFHQYGLTNIVAEKCIEILIKE
jgi:hypothetical protein